MSLPLKTCTERSCRLRIRHVSGRCPTHRVVTLAKLEPVDREPEQILKNLSQRSQRLIVSRFVHILHDVAAGQRSETRMVVDIKHLWHDIVTQTTPRPT